MPSVDPEPEGFPRGSPAPHHVQGSGGSSHDSSQLPVPLLFSDLEAGNQKAPAGPGSYPADVLSTHTPDGDCTGTSAAQPCLLGLQSLSFHLISLLSGDLLKLLEPCRIALLKVQHWLPWRCGWESPWGPVRGRHPRVLVVLCLT